MMIFGIEDPWIWGVYVGIILSTLFSSPRRRSRSASPRQSDPARQRKGSSAFRGIRTKPSAKPPAAGLS